jgi:hypothetical protein
MLALGHLDEAFTLLEAMAAAGVTAAAWADISSALAELLLAELEPVLAVASPAPGTARPLFLMVRPCLPWQLASAGLLLLRAASAC